MTFTYCQLSDKKLQFFSPTRRKTRLWLSKVYKWKSPRKLTPYQENAYELLACVFTSLLWTLSPGTITDYGVMARNPQNPRDGSCIEVHDRTRVRAVLDRDVARLLAQYLDANIVEEPTWLVSFGRVSLIFFLQLKRGPWGCEMESRRLWETFQVAQSGYLNPCNFHEVSANPRRI